MAELTARGACHGLGLPLEMGAAVLSEAAPEAMLSLAPYRGRAEEVSGILASHACPPLPDVGRAQPFEGGRIMWAGADLWVLRGDPALSEALRGALGGVAAVTDQSDAWAVLQLSGAGAAEVLARLVPVDLHRDAFPPGMAARTPLGHVACLLMALEEGFEIYLPRSFAASAVHDLGRAMRAAAGVAALRA